MLDSIAHIILSDWPGAMPKGMRTQLKAMRGLTTVEDDSAYRSVAAVRRGLGSWRTPLARSIKHELETVLARYRSAH